METAMAFKPNYNHQRAERNRAKEQKKQEKRQRRDEEAARRKGWARRAAGCSSAAIHRRPETSPANPSEDADGPQETTH
jgi:hypothetical protein